MSKYYFIYLCCFVIIHVNANSNKKGHLKKFGSEGPFLKIKETNDELSTKLFFENYVKTKTPLLIRNQAKKFHAYDKWTSDMYFYQQVLNFDENYEILVETVKKESRDQVVERFPFTTFLDNYKNHSIYMVSHLPDFLKPDIALPTVLQCEQAPKTLEKTIMWFSSGGTKSVTHTDDYENILCVLSGHKKIILVDYYKYRDIANNIIDVPDGSYSTMDVDKVDFNKYPGIENVEYYNVDVNAGDCIYIPFKWIHQVDSFDRNIAINFWFKYEKIFGDANFSDNCLNNKFDRTATLDKFDYEVLEDREQNFDDFRSFILRQINSGNRKLEHWKALLAKEIGIEVSSLEDLNLDQNVQEIFDLMDFDGNGHIIDEEVADMDINRFELIARIFEDIYATIQKKIEEIAKNEKNDKEHNEF